MKNVHQILEQALTDNAALALAIHRYGQACDHSTHLNEVLLAETETLTGLLLVAQAKRAEAAAKQAAGLKEQADALRNLIAVSNRLVQQAAAPESVPAPPLGMDN